MKDATPGGRRNNTLWALVIGLVLLVILFVALRSCGLGGDEPTATTTLQPSGGAGEAAASTVTPPSTSADPGVSPGAPAAPAPTPEPVEAAPAAS